MEIRSDYGVAYYNKAICYAVLDRVELAVDNLQQAIKLNSQYRQQARIDPYFSGITQNELFANIL